MFCFRRGSLPSFCNFCGYKYQNEEKCRGLCFTGCKNVFALFTKAKVIFKKGSSFAAKG